MIPGEMVIERVHGLQCTGIPLGERFALIMAEHRARILRLHRRAAYLQNMPLRSIKPGFTNIPQRQPSMLKQYRPPIQQRLGMPELRRFGSDGNLPGLKRSNSFGSFNQFRNRIPWRQSNGNLSRAGSASDVSQASWNSDGKYTRGRRMGSLRGNRRGRGRKQLGQLRQQPGRAAAVPARGAAAGRARGRGRGGVARGQQNRSQQAGGPQPGNRNQQSKPLPTKEELDAQLDEYMASSQFALDKELEQYMLKGATMDFE